MLIRKKIRLLFFALFFLGVIASFGQKYEVLGSSPGITIACPAGHEDMHSRVGTPGQNGLMAQMRAASSTPPTSEIQLIFRGSDAGDPDFRRACRHAADIWERYIVSSVPIVIDIGFENLGRNTLARAGPTMNFILTDDAYPDGRIFPVALANALLERDLAPNEPDIRVTVNSHWSIFYLLDYDTDGDPWPWQYDLVTIMLHEIGHGLGFTTSRNVDQNSGLGSRSRTPYRYDDFLENGSGTKVTDIPTPSNNLANFYTSNNLFIDGPNTVYRFGGRRPRIYSPSPYGGGSSIAHWDEGSFPSGNPNSLMTPRTGLNEAIHKPGTITLGLFADLGWTIHENGSFTADGIRFQITSSNPKTVMAVDYIGKASVVAIPEKVGGHTVNAIGNSAFKGNGLTRVTLPNGVASIGQDAFRDNQLTSIVIPNSVTSIGRSAFRGNRLESIVIPNNVTTIGNFAFRENQLGSITLGTDVTAIGYGAFRHNQLSNVIIPNGVTNIGGEAFANNPITKVTAQGVGIVPTIVTAHTFSNRHEIDLIVPPGKVQAYLDNGWTDFKTISEVAEIGRTFIAENITYKITSMAPNTVTATDYDTAGGDIVAIPETVDYGPNTYTVTKIGGKAFERNQLASVTIPASVTTIGIEAFSNNQLTHVNIGQNVTSIGRSAFEGNQLTNVTIPNSMTILEHGVFARNQLSNVEIPNSVISIKNYAFWENQLTSVTLPGSVTSIDAWVFDRNPGLNTVFVEATVPSSLAANAFAHRNQIDLVVPIGSLGSYQNNTQWEGFKTISEVAEIGGTFIAENITYKITSIAPNTVTVTGYSIIGGGVAIPLTVDHGPNTYTVTAIGNEAFKEKQLAEVTFITPSNVTNIGNNAFQGNELTRVDIPGGVTHIGMGAFVVNKLERVVIPNSLTRIEPAVFSHNQLTEVTIPDGVTDIRGNAFANNPIKIVVAQGAAPVPTLVIGNTFSNKNEIEVVVPKGSPAGSIKTAYKDAGWTGFKSITEGIQVSIDDAPEQIDNLTPFSVTISFNQNVTGFTKEDISVVNATVVDGSFSQVDDDSIYTIEMTPTSCDGTITIDVPGNVAEYAPNFPNLAASATVTVNAIPPAPMVSSPSVEYCVGETATALTATGDNLLWYTTEAGGIGTSTAPVPNTENAGEASYYVSQTINGCESERAEIILTVNAIPSAPAVSSPIEYCMGETATALAATGTNLLWYTPETGGTRTAPIPNTENAGETFYYVSQTNENGCESERTEIVITINAPVAPTVSSPVEYCVGQAANALTATGDNLLWYTPETGGTRTAPIPNTENAGETFYYVSQTNTNGCESERTEIVVTVNAPVAPTVSSPVEYCVGEIATALTASGDNLLWYTPETGGTRTAPIPNTENAGETFYYVSQTNENGCESERTEIVVTVNAIPSAPAVSSPIEYCVGETADALTASGDNLLWYTPETGGTRTAPIPNTENAGETFYYVSQTNENGCESERTEIVVTVNALPMAPAVNSSSVEYCVGETADALTATGDNLLWYTPETGGTRTAPIPNTENAGETFYYVSQTNTNGCESERTEIVVTVNAPVAPTVSSPVEYCVGETADALTATGINLLWYTPETGETRAAPIPNTENVGETFYYVSQTNENGCESERTEIVVTVNAIPSAPAVSSPIEYCVGETADALTASGDNLLWYTPETGGTRTAPIPNTENAGETFYYVSQTNENGCESERTEIVVTVNALPMAPAVNSSSVEYCVGEIATALTASGDNLLWFTPETGGTRTAPIPNTENVGETFYYVSQTNTNGCESERTEIVVTVNAPVAPTVSSPVEYCVGETATTLTASGTNILWYTTEAGGIGTSTAPIPNTENAGETFYYVSQTNTNGCESERAEIIVTVNAIPSVPTVSSSSVEYCMGETATALTATGDNLLWYTLETEGTRTAPIPNTENARETFYYVSQTNENGCESERTEIVVTVNAPVAPTVSSPIEYCVNETANALTAIGDNLLWYTTEAGGIGTSTPPIPNTANVGSASYYASQTNGSGCEGERAEIVVIVETCPAQIGDVFTLWDMDYEITSVNPNEIKIIDYIGSAIEVEIPVTVDNNGETYTVTAIGANAFKDNPDLVTVKIEADHPLSLHENAFAARGQIDLIVPASTRDDYLNAGWTGFKSIMEEGQVLSVGSNDELNDLTVYPNPARDKVHIELGPGQELKQVNIFTMAGAYLYSEDELEINTGRLSKGMYLFEIVTKTGDRSIKKIVIADR